MRLSLRDLKLCKTSSTRNVLESRCKQSCISGLVLTAVFRGKLPQVEILHGEVNEGGQFAGSSCLRETFQVWMSGRVKEQVLCVYI